MDTRMLIYGFDRDARAEDVLTLLGSGFTAAVEMVLVPGEHDEAIAVLHFAGSRQIAVRLAAGIEARRYRGRALRPWVAAMAWA